MSVVINDQGLQVLELLSPMPEVNTLLMNDKVRILHFIGDKKVYDRFVLQEILQCRNFALAYDYLKKQDFLSEVSLKPDWSYEDYKNHHKTIPEYHVKLYGYSYEKYL